MWALGVLAPSRGETICIPSSPVSSPCEDTCLDEIDDAVDDEDDDVVIMPLQSERTCVVIVGPHVKDLLSRDPA